MLKNRKTKIELLTFREKVVILQRFREYGQNILLTAIRASLEAGAEIMNVYTDPNADLR